MLVGDVFGLQDAIDRGESRGYVISGTAAKGNGYHNRTQRVPIPGGKRNTAARLSNLKIPSEFKLP